MMRLAGLSVDEILGSLEEGIREFMSSDRYGSYLKAMGRFREYSVNNITLINQQRPDATLVAGYSTWKNSFGRYVRKGETGIRIIAPVPVKVEKEKDVFDSMGNVRKEKVTVTVPRFRSVTVFDVSQTEGNPLPSIDPAELTSEVRDYDLLIKALERASPVPVSYADVPEKARGFYDAAKKRICIQKEMPQAQTVKTLVHEIAHSMLHSDRRQLATVSRQTREIEAESVAYTVCSCFGIDTSEYSFPYVSSWSEKLETAALRSSLETIRETSAGLIDQVEKNCRDIKRETVIFELASDIAEMETEYGCAYGDLPDDETSRIADRLEEGQVTYLMLFMEEAMKYASSQEDKERISDLIRRTGEFRRAEEPAKETERGER